MTAVCEREIYSLYNLFVHEMQQLMDCIKRDIQKKKLSCSFSSGSMQGEYQRKLYKELLANYNRLERPVVNDSAAILVELGFTLLQIIDVVRKLCTCSTFKQICTFCPVKESKYNFNFLIFMKAQDGHFSLVLEYTKLLVIKSRLRKSTQFTR